MANNVAKSPSWEENLPQKFIIRFFRAPPYRTRSYRHNVPRGSVFVVVLSGTAEIDWEEHGEQCHATAGAGDVLFWGPDASRWEANSESPRFTACGIDTDWTPSLPDLPHVIHDRRGLMRILAGEMLAVYQEKCLSAELQRQLLQGYFCALLAEFRRSIVVHSHPMVEKLRLFANEHMGKPIRIADLARYFGMGKSNFFRLYKAATGRTPMAEVNAVKADFARVTVLNLPQVPLKEVARRVGLRDHRQLGRLLKRHYGMCARDLSRTVPTRSADQPVWLFTKDP